MEWNKCRAKQKRPLVAAAAESKQASQQGSDKEEVKRKEWAEQIVINLCRFSTRGGHCGPELIYDDAQVRKREEKKLNSPAGGQRKKAQPIELKERETQFIVNFPFQLGSDSRSIQPRRRWWRTATKGKAKSIPTQTNCKERERERDQRKQSWKQKKSPTATTTQKEHEEQQQLFAGSASSKYWHLLFIFWAFFYYAIALSLSLSLTLFLFLTHLM